MARIRKLSEVLKEYSDFERGWHPLTEKMPDGTEEVVGFENPRYGKVERVVVCNDDGSPKFDQPQFELGPADDQDKRSLSIGSVVVPYYREGGELYFGLLERIRPLVRDPETGEQGSCVFYEPVSGYLKPSKSPEDTAIDEVAEETGMVVERLRKLSDTYPFSSFVINHNSLFVAEVEPPPKDYSKPETEEPIMGVKFYRFDDIIRIIKAGKMRCDGEAKAALLDVYAHLIFDE